MDNLPKNPESQDIEEAPSTDLSKADLDSIKDFESRGLPKLAHVDDVTVARMMDLYLSGKPYTEICRTMRTERALVVYLSKKLDWFSARRAYLMELQSTIKSRMVESKLRNQDFLLQLIQALQNKIGKKISKYASTDDETHINEINMKEVDRVLKTIDMVNKMLDEASGKKGASRPAVGLNLGDGVTIEKDGDNKVTITPKEKVIGDKLKQFADFRREEDKKKAEQLSDIKNKTKGDSNET